MAQANNVFIITLAMMLFGFILKKKDYLTETDGKTISKFLMHTTFPALLLVSTVRIKFDPNLLFIPIFSTFFGGLMVLIAVFVFKKLPNNMRGLLIMATGGFNAGLFGFPIIEGIWGRDALVYAIMFDIGNTLVVFGLTYTIGSYFASKDEKNISLGLIFKKVTRSPPLQAMFLGLSLNALNIPIPSVAMGFLDVLAQGNKPIVMLLMGIYLSFALEKKQVWAVSKVLLIRYVCGLLAVVLLYIALPKSLMQSILIVCAVLPAGLTLLPFSDEMNYDSRIAGLVVNLTLLISFGLMWVLVLNLGLV